MTAIDIYRMDGPASCIPCEGAEARRVFRGAGQLMMRRLLLILVLLSFVQPIKCSANAIRSQNTDNGKPCANLDIGSNGRMNAK